MSSPDVAIITFSPLYHPFSDAVPSICDVAVGRMLSILYVPASTNFSLSFESVALTLNDILSPFSAMVKTGFSLFISIGSF